MTRIRHLTARLRWMWTLTPQQADHLAHLKFPCC